MKKTDNHNLRAKLDLRRHFLRLANFGRPISVVDCFSGSEMIWNTLAREFEVGEYLALDMKEKRGRLKLDSVRYLQNQAWTHDVVDLDAYGSPWRHFFEVCKRGLSCVVFLTVGNTLFKGQQKEALAFLGIPFSVPTAIQGQLAGLVFEHCLAAPLRTGEATGASLRIERAAEALNPGGSARYIGLQLARQGG